MKKLYVNKSEWVGMFEAVGMTETAMRCWHEVFEARFPDAHQHFLEGLGIVEPEIEQIRDRSRSAEWDQ